MYIYRYCTYIGYVHTPLIIQATIYSLLRVTQGTDIDLSFWLIINYNYFFVHGMGGIIHFVYRLMGQMSEVQSPLFIHGLCVLCGVRCWSCYQTNKGHS